MEQQPRNGEVAIRDFTAGLVDIIDDNLIPDGAALKADNCISRTIGKLSKKRGHKADHPTPLSEKKIQGLFAYYNNAGTRRVIVANNGKIYSYNREESEFTQLLSGRTDTTEKFVGCIINGKDSVIGFNGVDHPYIWDGESVAATRLENYRKVQDEVLSTSDYKVYTAERGEWKSHGVIITSNGEVLSEEDYTLDAVGGRITFPEFRINEVTRERAIEWLSFTKFTTQHPIKPGSDPNTIVYDKDNNIVPSGLYTIVYDDGNRGAIVFKTSQMTKAPLRVSYQWADLIKADYQYKAGGEEIETEMNSMRLPAMYNGRVFVSSSISDRTSQIWFSEPNEPENWPPINYWEIKPGDGDVVTNLVAFMGQLVVFKRRSIHIFQGKSFNDFRLEEVDPRVGCVGPNAAVTHSMRMYFIGEGGLYEFNGLKAKNLVAEKIPQFWSTVNLGHIDKAVVTVWNELVLTALPVGSDVTENNTVLVYDTRTGAFWKWTNMPISCYCITSDATSQVLLSGHNAEGTVCQQDVGDTDMGEPIVAVWEPRAIDLGTPERLKKIKRCFLEEAPDMETHATFCLSPDYEDFTELTFYGSDGGVRMYRIPRELRRFRYIVPQITHSGAGEYEVRSIMFPYKLKRKPKVRRSSATPTEPETPPEIPPEGLPGGEE